MGALNNPKVGDYINTHFAAAYQKVATFKIVGAQKQGGNVASYFCAPDGRVLHAIAGPMDADTYLREATWVVETTKAAMKASNGDGGKFKEFFRKAHAQKLRDETGLVVEPITWDAPEQNEKDALTYSDPSGRTLAPKLPPPPIDGPDVRLSEVEFNKRQDRANSGIGAREMAIPSGPGGKGGRRVVVNNQALMHQILAAHSLAKIEKVYGTVFETVLGEKISTKPVDVVRPFSWIDRDGNRLAK